ncbi:MAG: PEP/pyruvate-binding domain-containing protein [bacterium]
MTSVTMWFESYWGGLKGEVGGKAASLGEMTGAGLPVPPGFAVTTAGYRAAHDAADLDATLARLLHGLDISDTAQVSAVCGEIREVIREMPLPAEIGRTIFWTTTAISTDRWS